MSSGAVYIDQTDVGTTVTMSFVLTDLADTLLPLSQVVEFQPMRWGVGTHGGRLVFCPEVGCPLDLKWERPRQAVYVHHPDEAWGSDPRHRLPDGYVDLAPSLMLRCCQHDTAIWCVPRDDADDDLASALTELMAKLTRSYPEVYTS